MSATKRGGVISVAHDPVVDYPAADGGRGTILQTNKTTRQGGVDAARYLLCYCVALLHALPRSDVGAPPIVVVVAAELCRGAVPFFFVASGYFARMPDGLSWGVIARPLRRLLPVYVIWLGIYAIANRIFGDRTWNVEPRTLLTGGSGFHLWFLPVLGVCLALVPAATSRLGARATGAACLMIALCNLAFSGYRDLLHLPEVGGTRMMMAPLLVFMGLMLRKRRASTPYMALGLLIAAVAASFGEELLISRLSSLPLRSHNDVAATFLVGLALFMLANSLRVRADGSILARLGRISLGVYCAHLLFVQLFMTALGRPGLGSAMLVAAFAICAATLMALAFRRVPLLRPLVE